MDVTPVLAGAATGALLADGAFDPAAALALVPAAAWDRLGSLWLNPAAGAGCAPVG